VHGVKKEEIQMQLAQGGTVGQLVQGHRGDDANNSQVQIGFVSTKNLIFSLQEGIKYSDGQSLMVGHRPEGAGEHGLLIIRQHGVEEQYSNVSPRYNLCLGTNTICDESDLNLIVLQDGHDTMVVRQHGTETHGDPGIIVRHGQVSEKLEK
jgi:hypothetical protein